MNRVRWIVAQLLTTWFVLLLVSTMHLEATKRTPLEEKISQAEALVAAFLGEHNVPGVSVAIGLNGEVIWTGGFGFANLQHSVPAGPHTVYRIASISKPITAVIAMMLAEEGKLDLDAPIGEYLPIYPHKADVMTMRHLLCHTSGIRHYRGEEFLSSRRYRSVLTPLAVFADDTLLFAPGEKFSYTTYGYTLASAVIEAAAGQSFLDLLREKIVLPNRLYSLAPEKSEQIIPNLASFYLVEGNEIYNAPYVDNSNKWAGGGLVATAEDLVRFALGLLSGEMISDSTREKMFTRQTTNDGRQIEYGLGWRIDEDEDTRKRVIWHTGGAMGGSGVLFFYPDAGVVYASLANTSRVPHLELARKIARLFVE